MEVEKEEEKGGPKAPQIRNKMTLYEMLSVSSQKFNPRPGGSSLSFPPHCGNGCSMGPSPSSSQDCRHEKSVLYPFQMSVPKSESGKYSTRERKTKTLVFSEYQSMEQSKVLDTNSVSIKTSQNEQRRKKSLSIKEQKKSAPIPHAGENLAEPDLPNSIDLNEDLHMESEEQDKKPHGNDASVQNKCLNDNGCRNASSAKNESCLKTLLDNSCRRENTGNDHNQEKDNKGSGERNEACDAPMVDSSSRGEVHPDDVVESIGPKQFWKARSAILKQQRVFAIQVFELHRLIKVQKLIAASPNMLLEGNPCLTKPSKKVPLKSLEGNQCLTKSSQQVLSEIIKQQESSLSKTQAVTSRQEDDLQKPKQNIEAPPSYSSCQDGLHREVNVQHPEASPSVACAQRPSSWCFPPPGNQWLVPVISPLEGLVYKPCAGPYLPNNGSMPPVYQGCAQLNTAYGIIATYQRPNISVPPGALPFSANYCPASYPIPVLNQAAISSAAEQVSPTDGSRPTERPEQSSCKKPNPKVVAYSGCLSKFQASKDGKAASNPCEKGQLVVQSAEGSVQPSRGSKNQTRTRVIKAVPQNAKSEPELATKIFQSIQEERQQLDT